MQAAHRDFIDTVCTKGGKTRPQILGVSEHKIVSSRQQHCRALKEKCITFSHGRMRYSVQAVE